MNKKEKILTFMKELNIFLRDRIYVDELSGFNKLDEDIIGGILNPIFFHNYSGTGVRYEVKGIFDKKVLEFFKVLKYYNGKVNIGIDRRTRIISENTFYKKIFSSGITEIPGVSYEELFYKLTLDFFKYKRIKNFYKDYKINGVIYIPNMLLEILGDKKNDLLLYKSLQNTNEQLY